MLRAWFPDGRTVPPDDFAALLELTGDDPTVKLIRHGERPREASQVIFLRADLDQYGDKKNPDTAENFAIAIAFTFEQVAIWLDNRSPDAMQVLQYAGIEVD